MSNALSPQHNASLEVRTSKVNKYILYSLQELLYKKEDDNTFSLCIQLYSPLVKCQDK